MWSGLGLASVRIAVGGERWRTVAFPGRTILRGIPLAILLPLRPFALLGALLSLRPGFVRILSWGAIRRDRSGEPRSYWGRIVPHHQPSGVFMYFRQSGVEVEGEAGPGIISQGSGQQVVILDRKSCILYRSDGENDSDMVQLSDESPKGGPSVADFSADYEPVMMMQPHLEANRLFL